MPPFTTTPEPNTSQPNMAYAAPAPQEAQVPVRKWGSRPTRDGTIAWLSTAEYAKGALAAIVQVSFTYPIHKVTFRQQIHGQCVRSTVQTLRDETVVHLFRGMSMPVAQRAIAVSIMFGVFHDAQTHLLPVERAMGTPRILTNWAAGAISGCTEVIMTPFERVQALMQSPHYHDHFKSSRDALKECLRIGGLRELFRGLQPVVMRNGLSSGTYFALREPVAHEVERLVLKESNSAFVHTVVPSFASGAFLGAGVSTVVYPLSVAKSRAHVSLGGPHQSLCSLLSEVVKERGSIGGLYSGCGVNVFRTLIGWGIVNVVYDLAGDLELLFQPRHNKAAD